MKYLTEISAFFKGLGLNPFGTVVTLVLAAVAAKYFAKRLVATIISIAAAGIIVFAVLNAFGGTGGFVR